MICGWSWESRTRSRCWIMGLRLPRGIRVKSNLTRALSKPTSDPAQQHYRINISDKGTLRMLEIKNLQVYYGAIHALKGIDFHLEEGEIVALIGANGAGKSTTLNSISGLLRPKSGEILFQGQNLTQIPPQLIVRKGI